MYDQKVSNMKLESRGLNMKLESRGLYYETIFK